MSGRDALEMKPQADAVDALEADMSNSSPLHATADLERRGTEPDRRKRTLHALLYGSFNPRRRRARRTGPATLRDLDWHEAQWLAVAMLIVVLSCVDAALTLTLIEHGAYEVNPVMAPIVGGSPLIFTLIKVGLTAGGVVLLTLLARMRAFGKIPVSFLLYAVLIGYGSLVIYELRLLEEISFT
jgi:hypothetical protein